MTELEDYIKQRIVADLTAALACPQCEAMTLLADPEDSGSRWCGLCGYTTRTSG